MIMVKRAVNPFQVTKPVAPGEVLGRDAEIELLVDLATQGNNARLIAPRRFGKTSLINRVQTHLEDTGEWIPVYVDLLGIKSADDFAHRIERAYSNALKGSWAKWFAARRRSLKPTVTAGGGLVPAAASVDLSGPAHVSLVDNLDLPLTVAKKTGQRIHVVFDEFQELLSLPGDVDAVVRSCIQHHAQSASYVFAGSQIGMMEQLFSDPKRAFYSQTRKVELPPLDAEALGSYIDSRFDATRRSITPEALGALLDFTRGHPQRSMLAAHFLWEACDASGQADLAEWAVARDAAMESVDDELRSTWSAIKPRDQATLKAIASGSGPYSRASGSSRGKAVGDSLDRLAKDGIIAKRGKGWTIVDPLLETWLGK